MAGALPGRAAGRGTAAQRRGPFRGRGGRRLSAAGLSVRSRVDRARGQTDHGPGSGPAADSGFRAGRVGNVRPAAARLLAAFGVAFAPAAVSVRRRAAGVDGVAPSRSRRHPGLTAATFSVSSWAYAGLVWLGRRRRFVTGLVLAPSPRSSCSMCGDTASRRAGWPWAGRRPPWRSPWPRRSTARSHRPSAGTPGGGHGPIVPGPWL